MSRSYRPGLSAKSHVQKDGRSTWSPHLQHFTRYPKNWTHGAGIFVMARVRLSSLSSNFQNEIDVFILPQLTKNLPSESIDEGLSIPSTVVLADPEFGQPGSIDLLLGAEVYSRLIRPGLIDLGDGKPTLQETGLGWIVFGGVRRRVPAAKAGNVMTITREDPLPALEKFWKLPAMTVQERLCEENFVSNVQFCPDQRLMVRLPFAENPRKQGKTLALAQRRFSSIESRLERDPAMLEGYVSFMDEYERLNHMTEVQLSSVPRNHYFIPH